MELQTVPKKRRTLLFTILISFCILILISLVFLNYYLNPLAKTLLTQQAEQLFGNNFEMGSINLSLWRGAIVIKDLALRQPPGFNEGYLIKAKSVYIRIALRPLLQRQLIINGIFIVAPEVNFIQQRNGKTNTEFYLNRFKNSTQVSTERNKPFTLELKKILISKGRFQINSYRLSQQQPSLLLSDLKLNLKNFQIPNKLRVRSPFEITGTILTKNPAHFKIIGSGVFLAGPVDFDSNTTIQNIVLTDYKHLYPPSNLTVKSGTATVRAETHCNRNYIVSNQHVEVNHLQVTSSNNSLIKNTFIGVPANIFAKILQDKKGMLDFDFQIKGYISDLKVNLKDSVNKSIAKSLKAKFAPIVSGEKVMIKSLKKGGSKAKNSFKKLFGK